MKKSIVIVMIIALLACGGPLHRSSTVSAASTISELTDIAKHWAKDQVEQAVAGGYVSGYPDGTFRPNEKVTRAQFIRMLVDALKLPSSQGGSPWYQPYVASALEIGLLKEGDSIDYPADISRMEIMRMLSRGLATNESYAVYLQAFSDLYNGDIPYVDYRDVADADVPHVAMVIGSGMVSGYPDFSLGLSRTATRAEAVVMIENFLATMTKAPETFRGLLELKEVAETGTNATTVSKLVPVQNLKTDPINISHSKQDSTIKRAYVLPNPSEGELSIFDRKMMWDRKGIREGVIEETPYFVLVAYEVKTKQRMMMNGMDFLTYVSASAFIPNTKGVADNRAVAAFGYNHNVINPSGIAYYLEKDKIYEVFSYSMLEKRNHGNMTLQLAQDGYEYSRLSKPVFTTDYKYPGW